MIGGRCSRPPPIGKPLTITDGNGTNVANNATHIANLNPLRYRSYVYDNESGFYYLMSRYYDPTTGRFISPDGQLNLNTMLGCNLYAYCENDPVNYVDPTGRSAILALFVITAVSGFFACASPAGQARTEEAFSNPSFYSIGNWLTMGAFGMVKGAVAPAQPFSAQHWIDSAGTAMLLMPAIGFADDVARNTKTNANSYTSRGSTGRTIPTDLLEQLAMEQVKSNPFAGTTLTKITLSDSRWPSVAGWVKMQQVVFTSKGKISIHYVYNQALNAFDDFKFVS